MKTEFEAKFHPVDKEKYREILKSAGATLECPERLMRRVIFSNKNNPQIQAEYLRVRDEGNCVRMSLKNHAVKGGALSDQKEEDIIVSNLEATVDILQKTGLEVTRYQENKRETWKLEGAEVTIDTWPSMQPLTEIEAESEEEVRRIAEKLGFDWEKRIFTSIVEVYADVFGLTVEKTLDLMDHLTFEDDPFASLTKDTTPSYTQSN